MELRHQDTLKEASNEPPAPATKYLGDKSAQNSINRDPSFMQNTKSQSPISRISKYSKLTGRGHTDLIDFEQYADQIKTSRYEKETFTNFD